MKRIIGLFLLFFGFANLSAQRHEIGLKAGMSNLVGDIGRTNYILQKPFNRSISEHGIPFYGGLIYRRNFNPYQSVRLDLGFSHVQFDDRYAQENYRKQRGLFGTNSGADADVVFEYNFLPVNNEQKSMLSPYVFGGIGAMVYSVVRSAQTETDKSGKKIIIAVPFGAGLKYKFNYNWALSGEFKFKPTFSDGIDYSMIDDKETRKNKTNSKDWVNSMTLGLTYSFGRPPCYCD
ncbi:hypothetical protein EIH07_11675 [Chryseobacterium taklimakanense]|uniref:type IX secretion system protein PorG n=1 Tax=Chryseobacterium taklimakanense TaxID=536441 RepID=UPI000F5F8BFA|nr:DUF6089 family protein [Chryseobacterium taklimakanense]AZI23805.1 hypothetical protein EIH07_11675 [Chryseobacterium taklimakanense]